MMNKKRKPSNRTKKTPAEGSSPADSADRGSPVQDVPGSTSDSSRMEHILNLAVQLASAQLGPNDRGRISHRDYDQLFEDALIRARRMVLLVSRDELFGDSEVQAYQLFEEGEVMSVAGIANRFNEYGWSGLSSKAPVEKLLESLRSEFQAEQADFDLGPVAPCEILAEIKRYVPELVRGYLKKRGFLGEVAELESFASDLEKQVHLSLEGLVIRKGGDLEQFYHWHDRREFRIWCFPEDGSHKYYRPYEIFRSACKKEWCKSRLVRRRKELSGGLFRSVVARGPFELFDQHQHEERTKHRTTPCETPPSQTSPGDPEEQSSILSAEDAT